MLSEEALQVVDYDASANQRAKLAVWQVPAEQSQALAKLAARSMQLQISIQDGSVYVSTADAAVELHPLALKSPTA